MLQTNSNDKPTAIVESVDPSIPATEPIPQLTHHSQQINTSVLSALSSGRRCVGCQLPFEYKLYSISNPHRRGLACLGCNKLFSFIRKEDLYTRLKSVENGCMDGIGDERRHLNNYHLHPLMENDLYHFPLSPKYYAKQANSDNQEEFIHHATETDKNAMEVYRRCFECTEFVKKKRKTLKRATQRTIGYGVASFDELMGFMVHSNATCALTGIKGAWSSFPGDPLYLLSLDHKVPLHVGGSSMISNLQVTLQGFNNVKGNYDAEDFKRWFEAIKQISRV
ncbi:hypothetical protein PS15p_210085 [Mucor circinelloides]